MTTAEGAPAVGQTKVFYLDAWAYTKIGESGATPSRPVFAVSAGGKEFFTTTDEGLAKKVAAAPELLFALKLAREWIEEARHAGCSLRSEATLAAITAAITKAGAL